MLRPSLTLACFLAPLGVATLLGDALPAQAHFAGAPPSRPPNIVYILTDDHALQAISAYSGDRLVSTPQIDRLASEGALFTRSYVGNSICSPSRASILTGLHSHAHGMVSIISTHEPSVGHRTFDGTQQTFPKLLQAAGYTTAIRGKWHLYSDPTGFDSWMVYPGQGNYYNPEYLTPEGVKHYSGYTADVTTDLSLAFLREQAPTGKPFFLAVHHKVPHREFVPPIRYLDTFSRVALPEPPTLLDDYATRSHLLRAATMTIREHFNLADDLKVFPQDQPPEWLRRASAADQEMLQRHYARRRADYERLQPTGDAFTRWAYQAYMQDYLGCVKAVDESVGRILDELERLGLAENTLVVYASDQGFYLGEHGWYDKRWMYEESFAMPLIMRLPGVIKPGQRIEALVQNIDHAPTLLNLAGTRPNTPMHGVSLLPLLRGERPADWRRSLYYAYFETWHGVAAHEGVATERYKLLRFPETGEWELFDRQTDPHELNNRALDPALAPVRAELESELQRLRTQYAVPADLPKAIPALPASRS